MSLSSLIAFAQTSHANAVHVEQHLLCSKFQERMILEEDCHRHILLPLPADDQIDFTARFFKKHFWATVHSFHWFTFISNVSLLLPHCFSVHFQIHDTLSSEKRAYLNIQLLNCMRDRICTMVSNALVYKTTNDDVVTRDALNLIFRELTVQRDLCRVLKPALKWFDRSSQRAAFMVSAFCVTDPIVFSEDDIGLLSDARSHLSCLANALECLANETCKYVPDCLTETQIFHMVESITSKCFPVFSLNSPLSAEPLPWALKNFIALLLLAPSVFKIVCNVRFRLVSWEELGEIIFEVLSSFDDWDQCYITSFMLSVKDFVHFSNVHPVKIAVIMLANIIWMKFKTYYFSKPFMDRDIMHLMPRMQGMITLLFTP